MYLVRPPFFLKKVFPSITWKVPVRENTLFLTFDDGPVPEVTPWVLSMLKSYKASATFFCVGENIKKYKDIYNTIMDQGCQVGNHTYNHLNGLKTNCEQYIQNVYKCDEEVDSKLFRPPHGKLRYSQYRVLKDQYAIVMWDVLSGDYDTNISPEKCLKNVLHYAKKGSIIVFHDSLKAADNLYYVLPRVLEYFSERDFDFRKLEL